MTQTIKKLYDTVTNVLDIHQSVLSGCIDIVVVEQPNQTLKSTPFHLRFGKFKALRGKDAIIDIYVNDKKTDLKMKLGRAGEGHFELNQVEKLKEVQEYVTDDAASEMENFSMSEDESSQQVGQEQINQMQEFFTGTNLENKSSKWSWLYGKFPQKNEINIKPLPQEKQKEQKPQQLQQKEMIQGNEKPGAWKSILGKLNPRKNTETKIQLDPDVNTDRLSGVMSPPTMISPSNSELVIQRLTKSPKEETFVLEFKEEEERLEQPQTLVQVFQTQQTSDPEVEISLCGHLINQKSAEQKFSIFQTNKIDFETFSKDPIKTINNPNLMIKQGDYLYNRDEGLAVLISKLVFNKNLTQISQPSEKKQGRTFLGFFFGPKEKQIENNQKLQLQIPGPKVEKNKEVQQVQANKEQMMAITKSPQNDKPLSARKLSDDIMLSDSSSIQSNKKRQKKSLKPTSDMLKQLKLNYGANKITYKIQTDLQGEKELTASIYLLKQDTMIFISDVDGTITKSDVMGQLLPMMGEDWSHAGVADLYTNIARNGYQVIYLTSRGIGYSMLTKGYIESVQQGQKSLPPGPVIMSPDRLIPSLKREVIDKTPEVFKIQALKDLRNMFTNEQALFAGFGNRENDALAYYTVGINQNRIYIIDTDSQIHLLNKTMITTYQEMNQNVDIYFPSLNDANIFKENEIYNDTHYWGEEQEQEKNIVDIGELFG